MIQKSLFVILIFFIIFTSVFAVVVYLLIKRPAAIAPFNQNQNQAAVTVPINISEADKEFCQKIPDAKEKDECLKIGYYGWYSKTSKEAITKNDLEKCQLFVNFGLAEGCLAAIARNLKDPNVCQSLTENKQLCLDAILFDQNDFNTCKKITDANTKITCFKNVISQNQDEKFCLSLLAEDQNLCLEILYTQQALNAVDYSYCRKIPVPSGVANCLKQMPPDSDGDGLSDYSEQVFTFTNLKNADTDGDALTDNQEVRIYKTDPENPDTDGDGYPDGAEVKAGYNPKGEGKLENF